MKYVIIGNSAAGINAAEEIRGLDKKAKITVISDEKDIAYSRCLISRYLDGRLKEGQLYFKTEDFYANFNIEAVLGESVVAIDRKGQKVSLNNGGNIDYDKLLLATGSRPQRPKICGLGLKGIFNFYSLEDARIIKAFLKGAKKAVIAGAGFVGLEAAYALRKLGLEVAVVERCPQILPNQFDLISSELIKDDLEGLGVEVLLNESLTSVNGNTQVESITFAETEMPCGLLIFCTGVRPNTELAESTGLNKSRGIIVDEFLRTSDPNIYASGDCIEIEDITTGKRQPSATWFNAVLQGRFAASNMSGIPKRYSGSVGIQNSVQFHRLSAVSFGMTQLPEGDLEDEVISSYNKEKKIYRKLIVREGYLYGMIFVGDISKAGLYAALIRNRINICEFKDKLLDPDFSHAFFRKENFEQLRPCAKTPACWQSPYWMTERVRCMGIK